MKYLIASALIFVSVSAFACPDLTGSYDCRNGSHVSMKEIVFTEKSYYFNSDGVEFTYYPDGNTYEVEANERMKDGKVKSYCKNDKLFVDFNATILYEGSAIAKQKSVTEYVKTTEGMIITTKTKMKGLPMPTLKLLCNKL